MMNARWRAFMLCGHLLVFRLVSRFEGSRVAFACSNGCCSVLGEIRACALLASLHTCTPANLHVGMHVII